MLRSCLLAVLVAGCAAGVSQTSGPAPVAEAPSFKPGDEWRWTNGGHRRVIAVEAEESVTSYSSQYCRECRAYRDKNLTIVRLVDKEGNLVVLDWEVGYKMLDFPLKVGKQWASNATQVSQATKIAQPYKNLFIVEAYEDVKTKAGTFKAFRIGHVQELEHASVAADVGRTWREDLWYSPEVKAFVKREVITRVDWGPNWELESFSVK